MADGKIEIETGINTDGAKKGVSELSNTLGKLTKGSTVSSLAKIGASATGIGLAFVGAVKGVKATSKAMKELADTYKVQQKAEKQLESSARNNPYLDTKSVNELKAYASQLQSISTVGDEQLLPFMSQLASAGRTQTEIQQIMSASLDLSASGMMSLDSAVTQLNATYSGNLGLLGRQISSLKNLTSEDLKNGKAVELIGEQYKGISKEIASTTGSAEQLSNAWGDLKEELGEPLEKGIFAPFRKGLTNVVNDTIEHIKNLKKSVKEVQDESDRQDRKKKGKQTAEDIVNSYEYESEHLEKLIALYKEIAGDYEHYSVAERGDATKKIQSYSLELAKLKEKNELSKKALELAEKESEEKRKAQIESEKQAELDKKAQASIDKYKQTVADAQKEIEFRRQLGEEISQESEDQEMLNVRTQAWIQMIKDSEGTISGQKGFAKEESERIAKEVERLNAESQYDGAKELVDTWQTQKDESLKAQLEMLQNYEDYLSKKANLTDEEIAMQEKIKDAKSNINSAMQEEEQERFQQTLEQVTDFLGQFQDITNSMTSLVRDSNEKETQEELSALSKQYTDGLISYEEYCDKKEQIDKESAQKEYKLKMWEWTASLLTATANIAQGVSKAIADGGVAGIISGAMVGVAGAVQIATLMANKPQPPKFAHGGIVGGSSYTGDHVVANVNSGEMILNANQQKALWNMANGNGGGGSVVNMPITIENNASNEVSASAQMSKEGLRVVIDKFVNSSMSQGRYNNSMQMAEISKQGVSIL